MNDTRRFLAVVGVTLPILACAGIAKDDLPDAHQLCATSGGGVSIGGVPNCGETRSTTEVCEVGGSTGEDDSSATGGADTCGCCTNAGGMTATGGTTSTGGCDANGGMAATGGMTATGGMAATGGTTSTGGCGANGGMTATGGSKSSGGCSGQGTPEIRCETAYAMGNHPFDKRDTGAQRWGWAIFFSDCDSTANYDVYAGAAHNDPTKGTKVGTLTFGCKEQCLDSATITLFSDYYLKEAHLYAACEKPTKYAPGQYGNTAYLEGKTTSFTFDHLALSCGDADAGSAGYWLIAHAVVCGTYPMP